MPALAGDEVHSGNVSPLHKLELITGSNTRCVYISAISRSTRADKGPADNVDRCSSVSYLNLIENYPGGKALFDHSYPRVTNIGSLPP